MYFVAAGFTAASVNSRLIAICKGLGGNCVGLGFKYELLLWMDGILHQIEPMANLCLLAFTGESSLPFGFAIFGHV